MTGLDILEKMNDLDPELLEQSEAYRRKRSFGWIRYASVAAAVLLVTVVAVMMVRNINQNGKTEADTEEAFVFQGDTYREVNSDELVQICVASDKTKNNEETFLVTESDCGELLGLVTILKDGEELTLKVYRFSQDADEGLCVVEYPDGRYRLYEKDTNETKENADKKGENE